MLPQWLAVFNLLMCSVDTCGEKRNTSILPKYTDSQILGIYIELNLTILNGNMNMFKKKLQNIESWKLFMGNSTSLRMVL